VSTPVRNVRYVLKRRHRIVAEGRGSRRLVFQAPSIPGTYTFEVLVGGHSAQLELLVSRG
jgi:hypothetical protein